MKLISLLVGDPGAEADLGWFADCLFQFCKLLFHCALVRLQLLNSSCHLPIFIYHLLVLPLQFDLPELKLAKLFLKPLILGIYTLLLL